MRAPIRIRDVQGCVLGLLFVALGTATFVLAGHYPMGTAVEMGPGYLPRLLGGALVVVGVLVVAGASRRVGPALAWRPVFRPLVWLAGGTVAFGAFVDRLGLVAAMVALLLAAVAADRARRPRETIVLVGSLTVASVAIFVVGLGVRLRLWPWGA